MWRSRSLPPVHGCLAGVVAGVLGCTAGAAAAQTSQTTITYQGQLSTGQTAVDGTVDLRFRLYTELSAGTQVGPQLVVPAVEVDGGVFTASLDFGAAAWPTGRYLEIDVRGPSDPGYFTLSPRQAITASPYSLSTRGISIGTGLLGQTLVGVNTTTPEFPIDVHFASPSGAFGAGRLLWTGQGGSYLDVIRDSSGNPGPFGGTRVFRVFGGNDFAPSTDASFSVGMASNHPLTIKTNDQPRVLIAANGDVGIGTATPTARLHVSGTPGVDGIRFPDGSLQTTAGGGGGSGARGPLGVIEFTGDGSFAVPGNVTSIMVEMWGGGGGGSPGANGGGGGGGAYVRQVVLVVPGELLQVDVGSGGAIGQAGQPSRVLRGGAVVASASGGGGGTNMVGGLGGVAGPGDGIRRDGTPGDLDGFFGESAFAGRTFATADDITFGVAPGYGAVDQSVGCGGYIIVSW